MNTLPQDNEAVNSMSVNWLKPTATVAEFMRPYDLGRLTAEQGELCLPELYYTRKIDMREFARGYQSIVGSDLLSDQVLGRRLPTGAEIMEELLEYVEDIEDRQYWSRGGW